MTCYAYESLFELPTSSSSFALAHRPPREPPCQAGGRTHPVEDEHGQTQDMGTTGVAQMPHFSPAPFSLSTPAAQQTPAPQPAALPPRCQLFAITPNSTLLLKEVHRIPAQVSAGVCCPSCWPATSEVLILITSRKKREKPNPFPPWHSRALFPHPLLKIRESFCSKNFRGWGRLRFFLHVSRPFYLKSALCSCQKPK